MLFWYHPEPDVSPQREIPALEIVGANGLDAKSTRTVEVALQEIGENGVDGAHFQYVHGTSQIGEILEVDFSGDVRRQRVAVRYNTRNEPSTADSRATRTGPVSE